MLAGFYFRLEQEVNDIDTQTKKENKRTDTFLSSRFVFLLLSDEI